MNECILKLSELNKIYNEVPALQDVSVSIEKGKIYGFIGQNGAGKTTLMRIITGLAYPSAGNIELFGTSSKKGLENGRKRIGCMIEHAALYPNLTAKENLVLQCKLKDISGKEEIESILKIVGLEETGKKKFKNFSMGMKQRLGIAAALIGDPEFLILDEPVNGLDPLGIIEIREMLKKLNRERNMTIIISSHILGELYMLATDYIIIDKGRIVSTLTTKELDERCKNQINIELEDIESGKLILSNGIKTDKFTQTGINRLNIFDENVTRDMIAKEFFDAGIMLTELSCTAKSLERFFVDLIEEGCYV